MPVAVIDSGSGNLRSVERALQAVGSKVTLTSDPEEVRRAGRIVVPGQGAFGDCVDALRERGLDEAISDFIATGNPYFGICLGLQILFDGSEESPNSTGLGVLPGQVCRFAPSVGKVPHMGWNSVHRTHDFPLLEGIPSDTYFYFIHSFFAKPKQPELVALECEYSSPFVAAVQHENLFACQFHPEKSQGAGLKLLANFAQQ